MIISENKKFMYVDVPKTGSTSIKSVLSEFRDLKTLVKEGFSYSYDFGGNLGHVAMGAIDNKLNFDEFYKFGFFRNPWELAVSKFFFHNGYNVVESHKPNKSERTYRMGSCFFNEWARMEGFLDCHYESKTRTMWDMVAVGDRILVDEIYDFSRLRENWITICNKLNIPFKELPNDKNFAKNTVCNEFQKFHYSHYYEDKTIEIVREQFAREIEYFNYKFEDKR
jgi:hypothetical protein